MNWLLQMQNHYRNNKDIVDIFGVILYTDANPHIKKLLSDNDYWEALNEISGHKWAVFSIKVKPGYYSLPSSPPGSMSFMVPVWKEPSENKPILEMFGINSTKVLPLLVVFTQDADDNILKIELKIKDDTIEEAYNSLKKHIYTVTESVERINDQYKKNSDNVFNAVKMSVEAQINWERFKKGIELAKWIKEIFTLS